MGNLGNHGVLQAHDEAQHHHGGGHEQPLVIAKVAAEQAKAQQQDGLQHQGQGIFAVQVFTPCPVDEDGGSGRASQEGQQRAKPLQDQPDLPQHQVVRHGRNDARHVGGVLLHGKEAAGVGGAGHEAEIAGKLPVGLRAAYPSGEVAQVGDGHGRCRAGGPLSRSARRRSRAMPPTRPRRWPGCASAARHAPTSA